MNRSRRENPKTPHMQGFRVDSGDGGNRTRATFPPSDVAEIARYLQFSEAMVARHVVPFIERSRDARGADLPLEDEVNAWMAHIDTGLQGKVRCTGCDLCRPVYVETRRPTYISAAVREQVYTRNRNRCATCKSKANLTIDHIVPVALGGTDHADNLQTLCRSCNSRKGSAFLGTRSTT